MKRPVLFVSVTFVMAIILLGWGSIVFLPKTAYYPHLVVSYSSDISTEFFFNGNERRASCEAMLAATLASASANCPACKLESDCALGLSDFHRRALGRQPIPVTSLRLGNGVLVIHTKNVTDASALCGAIKGALHNDQNACIAPDLAR